MKLRDEEPAIQADEKAPWVERETLIEASPEEVWEALTDEDRLEEWLAPDVELDPSRAETSPYATEMTRAPKPSRPARRPSGSPSPGRGPARARASSSSRSRRCRAAAG